MLSDEKPLSEDRDGPRWDPKALEELVEGLAAKQEASHKIWKLYMEESRIERKETNLKLQAIMDLLQQFVVPGSK
jgi:hypothetical protein